MAGGGAVADVAARARSCAVTVFLVLMTGSPVAGPASAGPAGARSRAPAPQAQDGVTFTRDVAPVLFSRCVPCHRPGGAGPFGLLTYAEARRHARQIVSVTASRFMPPWKPAPGYGEFAHSRRLSDGELDVLRRWVEQGTPEGEPSHLPPAPTWSDGWQLGMPDVIVRMPEPYVLQGEGADVFRTFVIPIPTSRARYVKGVEFRTTGVKAVHHANLKLDATRSSQRLDAEDAGPGFDGGSSREAQFPDGHFLGWTPGQAPRLRQDAAWRLPTGSDLVIEAHLVPTGRPEAIQVSVGLFFSEQAPALVPYMLRIGSQRIDVPAGDRRYVSTDSYVLPVDVDVLAVQPHAHLLATRLEGFARLPDNRTQWLINIPDWDVRWQDVYEYRMPLRLPAGTTIVTRITYDNSADNPRNPHRPPKRVTFGQSTTSEMGDLWLQVLTRDAAQRSVLDRDYAPKMLEEDTAGVEKALETTPADTRLHIDLALCYLAAGRTADAIRQLERAVGFDPESAPARYELGTMLLDQRRFDEALPHLAKAVALRPTLAEAHNNLGVLHFLVGRVDAAIRSYAEAVRARPDHAEAHYNLGRARQSAGDMPGAEDEYRRAIALAPGDAEAHTSLASLLAGRGLADEAVAHYRSALEFEPDLVPALADLAWILGTSEQTGLRAPLEAVQLAERAAALTGRQDATVLDVLAAAQFSAGHRDLAIETARIALELATRTAQSELARRIEGRLRFYQQQTR